MQTQFSLWGVHQAVKNITTQGQARQYAIDWQNWQADQVLSLDEVAGWQSVFADIAERFGLVDEFTENGII